ncbi:MAG: tetratricopeptide repeat protein [bacterium]|nr:tetratricopeptide repeat protein [bacterium]
MVRRKSEGRGQRSDARKKFYLTSYFLLLVSIFVFLFFASAFAGFTPEQQTQLSQLQEQVNQNPTDTQTGKKLAQIYALYVEAQEQPAGVDYFINFLAENPVHPYFSAARRLLGNLYQNQKNFTAARNEYQQVIAQFPNTEDARRSLYCIAIGYTEAKQYVDAIAPYTSYIEKYPNDKLVPNCYYHIAESYAESGNLEQAAATFSNIQIKDVKKAGAFQTSGWAKKAAEYLDQYLAKATSPEDKASTYLQRGIYAQLLGDATTARNSFCQAYQLEPTSEVGKKALYYQGLSYLSDKTYTSCNTTLSLFSQIANQFASDSLAINSKFYSAVVQYRIKDRTNALSTFLEFIEKYPNHEWTLKATYLAAIIYKDTKRDYPNAITYFDKTLDLLTTRNPQGKDPGVSYWQEEALTPDSLLYRSWEFKMHVYLNLYGFDSAIELGNQVQALYPAEQGIHQLGKQVPLITLQWQGNWQELITQCDSFLIQLPASTKKWVSIPGCALYLKAFALEKLSKDTEAIAVYEQAVNEYPESRFTDTGLMFMGKCYEHLGDYYSAVSTYNRYLALFSGRTLTYEAYLLKANALAKLGLYTEAIATLDTFLTNYTNRYDRPDGTILQAKELKAKYQAQLAPVQLTSEEMGQLVGGCPCYPCGITGCGCVRCNQTSQCYACSAPNCVCNEQECELNYGACGCGAHCGCEFTCHWSEDPMTHRFACGWMYSNPTDKTCGCAGAAQCPCCSGPLCGNCLGTVTCKCEVDNQGQPKSCGNCPNYCADLGSCPSCAGNCSCDGDDCPSKSGTCCHGCTIRWCFCDLPHCEELTTPCHSLTSHTPNIQCTHAQKECIGAPPYTAPKGCSKATPLRKPCNGEPQSGCCGGCWSEWGMYCVDHSTRFYKHDRCTAYGCRNPCGTPHCIKAHGPGDGCDCGNVGMCNCGSYWWTYFCEDDQQFWDGCDAARMCRRCSNSELEDECPNIISCPTDPAFK